MSPYHFIAFTLAILIVLWRRDFHLRRAARVVGLTCSPGCVRTHRFRRCPLRWPSRTGCSRAGGDLSPERLVAAYRRGIFPWFSAGQPILWWSPDPRMVLYVDEFPDVALACQTRSPARIRDTDRYRLPRCHGQLRTTPRDRPGEPGSRQKWSTPTASCIGAALRIRVESWRDGQLCGRLYGMALGRVFFGESMFARETDASKVALVHLVALLRHLNVPLIDCQQETAHLRSFGARPIRRAVFAAHLERIDTLDRTCGRLARGGVRGIPDRAAREQAKRPSPDLAAVLRDGARIPAATCPTERRAPRWPPPAT